MDLSPDFEGLSSFQVHTSNNCCLAKWPPANTRVIRTPVFPSSSSTGAFLSASEWGGAKCGNKRGYIYNLSPFGIHNLESPSGRLSHCRFIFLHWIHDNAKFHLEVGRSWSRSVKLASVGALRLVSRPCLCFPLYSSLLEYETLFGSVQAPALTRLESKSLAISVIHSV